MLHTIHRRTRLVLLAAGALSALTACGTTFIGSTQIPDTEPNRELYGRVMQYREAVEKRDADTIEAMVSREYSENGTTTDRSTDDYGYDKLKTDVLGQLRDNVLDVQLRILMTRIEIDGDRAVADYEFYYNFKYVEGGVSGWKPKNDFNRLEFVREDGVWKIAGGL